MANKNPSPATRFKAGKEQEKVARKGGKASGAKRKRNATFRECFEALLDADPERMTKMCEAVLRASERGNLKAFEIARDTMGQKPVERIEAEVYEDDGLLDAIANAARVVDDTDLVGDADD